jgi:hypothetical protein
MGVTIVVTRAFSALISFHLASETKKREKVDFLRVLNLMVAFLSSLLVQIQLPLLQL